MNHMIKKIGSKVINLDGWMNVLTGLGIKNRDKKMSAEVSYSRLEEQEAEQMYAGDAMCRKVVDIVPDDALRKGFHITGIESDLEKKIQKRLVDLNAVAHIKKTWQNARLYGGSALFVVQKGTLPESEVVWGGKIQALVPMTRWELWPIFTELQSDITKAGFGLPMKYTFQPRFGSESIRTSIHASQLIRFEGDQLPERLRIQNSYWNESILTKLISALRGYGTAHDAASSMMQDIRTSVFKIKNLADQIASGDDQAVINRLRAIDLSRSIARAVVIDAEGEEFEYRDGSVTGVDALISKAEQRLSGESDIPHTILLGESPNGSNATGNSTTTRWYDYISTQQETYLKQRLVKLIKIIMLEQGFDPTSADWDIEFESLWQMDDKESATIRYTQAQTDAIYIERGVVDPNEVAASRFGTGKYSTETEIDMSLRSAPVTPVPEPVTPENLNA